MRLSFFLQLFRLASTYACQGARRLPLMETAEMVSSLSFSNAPNMSATCDMDYRMYSKSVRKVSSADTKALGERIVGFLRQKHPMKTAANVSADIGLPSSTIAKWLEGAASPGGYAVFKLIDFYGGDLIAAAWPRSLGFLSEAAREEKARKLDARIAALKTERAAL